ncbi:MAG: DUF1566 domain-containing protein [Bacteroidales bacterium]|nr:DUF1566 domain-containing protein [Bacteroidales bacterium]
MNTFNIPDTGAEAFYDNDSEVAAPEEGDPFYGQDAHYRINPPSYTDNGDGTVTDNVTGLTWQQDMGEKMSWDEAMSKIQSFDLGGYDDWRVPSIKELYSLILFTGKVARTADLSIRFIDTDYFIQPIGDEIIGERFIDAQTWTSTHYVGTTMNGNATIFGVNFIDGRIKGYPEFKPATGSDNKMYFRFVRGNPDYGENLFVDDSDGTVSDLATGLMWQQSDDGISRNWKDALSYAENLELAGHSDWRLPDAKELQSIVDYTRAPAVTQSPALDPLFYASEIKDPEGNGGQYPYYWTGTTHLDGPYPGSAAVYVCFGKAQGFMHEQLLDVHGAGAQRSDPKDGNPEDYPAYWGPQGDVRYVFNYVRCVRTLPQP